uniref:Uncharacterized protein n=1 Tax=Glossina palpalis gambiensis TaxID=67801 RepID=A0A1B0C1H2_9MUSC
MVEELSRMLKHGLNNAGLDRRPRATIIPSALVCSCKSHASCQVRTPPLATRGIWRDCLTSCIAATFRGSDDFCHILRPCKVMKETPHFSSCRAKSTVESSPSL